MNCNIQLSTNNLVELNNRLKEVQGNIEVFLFLFNDIKLNLSEDIELEIIEFNYPLVKLRTNGWVFTNININNSTEYIVSKINNLLDMDV